MLRFLVLSSLVLVLVQGQNWVTLGRYERHTEYWRNVMQELVKELERREWCNLKMDDIVSNINDNLYDFQVTGTANYVNGFLQSIQKIDIADTEQMVTAPSVGGVVTPHGTIRGKLNFRDVVVGWDVIANLTSPEGIHRSTGTFHHSLVQFTLDLQQNLVTKEILSGRSIISVSRVTGNRMQYMPSTNVTEALSRRFYESTFGSAQKWADNIFIPIMHDIATNIVKFPEVCYSNCQIL